MSEILTVFYSKSSGNILSVVPGNQTFNYFSQFKEDYELIANRLIVEYNEYFLFHVNEYFVDLKTNTVQRKQLESINIITTLND